MCASRYGVIDQVVNRLIDVMVFMYTYNVNDSQWRFFSMGNCASDYRGLRFVKMFKITEIKGLFGNFF